MNPIIVYLSLGSNIGDREKNLRAAWDALAPVVHPLSASPIYETAPWGYEEQPAFLNQVIRGETILPPLELLSGVKNLETQLGRTPNFHYGPRSIDIDILLYGDQIIKLPNLTIPHPHIPERAFVLVPLADLAPNLLIPGVNESVLDLLHRVDTGSVQRYHPNQTSTLS